MRRRLTIPTALATVALGLAACGSSTAGGATTCEEWLALGEGMSIQEQLGDGDGLTDEAAEILEDALEEQDLATDALNVQRARASILQFCGADGTGTRPNLGEPISRALKG